MTKKHFIALADVLRNEVLPNLAPESRADVLNELARFCKSQNPNFDRERWLGYIAGTCGPNGGAIKPAKERKGMPLTGDACYCRPGVERDNCPQCEGTGREINWTAFHAARRAGAR